jgi:hypothetical protein
MKGGPAALSAWIRIAGPPPQDGSSRESSRPLPSALQSQTNRRNVMGKYLIGWMLGVPVIVLVIVFIFFH